MLIIYQSQAYDRQMYLVFCCLRGRSHTLSGKLCKAVHSTNLSTVSFFPLTVLPSSSSAYPLHFDPQFLCLPSSFCPSSSAYPLHSAPQLLCLPSSFCPTCNSSAYPLHSAPQLLCLHSSFYPSSSAYPLHSILAPLLTLFILPQFLCLPSSFWRG